MRTAFERFYADHPVARFKPWSQKEAAMVRQTFVRYYGDRPDYLHDLFTWSVEMWPVLMGAEFGWTKKVSRPDFPDIRFMCQFYANFEAAYRRRALEKHLKAIPDEWERRRAELTTRDGKSAEEADRIIAEERAMARIRSEVQAKLNAAAAKERAANIALKQASKLGGPRVIHPESATAVAMRREAIAKRYEDVDPSTLPSLEELAKIPFREDD